MKTVFDVLKKKCQELGEVQQEFLATGGAKDYAEYKEVCGVIRGLALAQREIQDLSRNYMEDDND